MSNTDTKHVLTAAMVAAYCNAQVREIETGKVYELVEIQIKRNMILAAIDVKEAVYANTCKFQLVLTSPDKITDAKALIMAKKHFVKEELQTAKTLKNLLSQLNYSDTWEFGEAVEFTDICRSLNIDMGYKSIPSLIAAGLAVEKTNDNG